jgi:hypothetical protein
LKDTYTTIQAAVNDAEADFAAAGVAQGVKRVVLIRPGTYAGTVTLTLRRETGLHDRYLMLDHGVLFKLGRGLNLDAPRIYSHLSIHAPRIRRRASCRSRRPLRRWIGRSGEIFGRGGGQRAVGTPFALRR